MQCIQVINYHWPQINAVIYSSTHCFSNVTHYCNAKSASCKELLVETQIIPGGGGGETSGYLVSPCLSCHHQNEYTCKMGCGVSRTDILLRLVGEGTKDKVNKPQLLKRKESWMSTTTLLFHVAVPGRGGCWSTWLGSGWTTSSPPPHPLPQSAFLFANIRRYRVHPWCWHSHLIRILSKPWVSLSYSYNFQIYWNKF